MKEYDFREKPVIVYKYGGNAMIDEALQLEILTSIASMKSKGYRPVIAHGGGPFIKQILKMAAIESKFIDGHRQTTPEAFEYVEMALKGKVNSKLVGILNSLGYPAAGISGRDGGCVIAQKRRHKSLINQRLTEVDLGQVGDVKQINPDLILLLLDNGYIPVVSCIAADEDGLGYNINGDMFAGHLAAALKAQEYIILTDVDGLLKDKNDPDSKIKQISIFQINQLIESGSIQGGMIPKIESCVIALRNGAQAARILNGTIPEQISQYSPGQTAGKTEPGTLITSKGESDNNEYQPGVI